MNRRSPRPFALSLSLFGLALGGCGQQAPVASSPAPAPTRAVRTAYPMRPMGPTASHPAPTSAPAAGGNAGSGSARMAQAPAPEVAGGMAGSGSSRMPEAEELPAGPVDVAGIHFEMPSSWVRLAPTSSMRAAQARIPGPAGDAELTMFFFGVGGGGDVESNLQRWTGQMAVAPGSQPQRLSFEAGPLKTTMVEVVGTRQASGMGMGPSTEVAGQQLVAAVVEGPGGPWFFKLIGPEATVAAARQGFQEMLKRATPAG